MLRNLPIRQAFCTFVRVKGQTRKNAPALMGLRLEPATQKVAHIVAVASTSRLTFLTMRAGRLAFPPGHVW